tara:strand:+ start:168332 stop:168583 length:252 start_codon:yes stop_codon:yes gene_type:complete
MKKKTLNITISGEIATGKSRILHIVRDYLVGNGFEVEQVFNADHPTKENFDKVIGYHLDDAIESIKSNSKIVISEVQLNRKST